MSDIRGIGVDLCEIARMQAWLDEGRSLRRLFTEEEQAYIASKGATAAQTMAGLFAAKEAVLKAMGTGMTIPMTDIVITHTDLGQPIVILQGKAAALGGTVLISQYWGKKDTKRIKQVFPLVTMLTLCVAVVFVLLAQLCPEPLLRLVLSSSATLSVARNGLGGSVTDCGISRAGGV